MTIETETALEQFTARADQLTKIYKANPQRFAVEREAVTVAEAAFETAKHDAVATIARREQHTGMIEAAHRAGALNDWEKRKILERYASEYATPNIEEAQRTLDATWESFWNALKKTERQTEKGRT